MSDVVRLCRLAGGTCLSYCSYRDREHDTCRRAPRPPKRWGNGATVIEVPVSEFNAGELGSGESEVVEPTIGRPSTHVSSYTHVPRMDGASIEQLQQALSDLEERW